MISVWRITKTRYAAAGFDGEGARLHGGRWNSRGTRVAYASGSVALAVLELLVGLQDTGLLSAYSLIQAEFPESLVEVIDHESLPSTWKQHPPSPETQRVGDLWLTEGRSVVLRVPSAIVEAEYNYLLNPAHGGFAQVMIHRPERFRLDPRLVKQAESRTKR